MRRALPRCSTLHRRVVVRLHRRRARPQRRGIGRLVEGGRGPVHAADSVASACAAAAERRSPHDRIVVFGSFHTVGPAIDWLESRGCCCRPETGRVPNILTRDGSSRQRTADRRIDPGCAGRAGRTGIAVGPKADGRDSPPAAAAAEPLRNVTVDLTTSKAPAQSRMLNRRRRRPPPQRRRPQRAVSPPVQTPERATPQRRRAARTRCATAPRRQRRRRASRPGGRAPAGRGVRTWRRLNPPHFSPTSKGMVRGLCSSAASPAARTPTS